MDPFFLLEKNTNLLTKEKGEQEEHNKCIMRNKKEKNEY